jgi:hypothetical protein
LPANNDDEQFLPGSSGKMLYYFVDLYTNLVVFRMLQVTHITLPMRCQPTMMTSSFFQWKARRRVDSRASPKKDAT